MLKFIALNEKNLEFVRTTRNLVKKHLINKKFISKKQQKLWYNNDYLRGNERVFLCLINKIYVGYCQYNVSSFEIGIKINPEYQEKKYGFKILKLLINNIYKDFKNKNIKLKALILSDNIKSINLFLKLKFKIKKKNKNVLILQYEENYDSSI